MTLSGIVYSTINNCYYQTEISSEAVLPLHADTSDEVLSRSGDLSEEYARLSDATVV